MCSARRRIDPALIEQLTSEPQRFDFFQAVRVLDRHLRKQGAKEPVADRLRFRNSLALAFAPSQIETLDVEYASDDEGNETDQLRRVSLTPAFMGLLGLHGTLPAHYTEQIADRERYHRDRGARHFLDLFSNRSVGQFYNAWKKYRLPLLYETERHDQFLPLVLALGGLGFDSLRNRLRDSPGSIDDESMAYFAGMLRQRPVSATSLQTILSQYFRTSVKVEQFIGKWYTLPESQHSKLGGANAALGKTMMVGERVWQRNLRVRIRIGPLSRDRYLAFLPGSELSAALHKILTLATSYQFEYEIRPVLRAADVLPSQLGAEQQPRLGFDTFLCTRAVTEDRDDTVFELHAA